MVAPGYSYDIYRLDDTMTPNGMASDDTSSDNDGTTEANRVNKQYPYHLSRQD